MGRGDSVDGTVNDADDDVATLGVRHRHQRDGQVAGADPPGLALEPLVLGQADEILDRLVGRQCEHAINGTRIHETTVTFFQFFPVGGHPACLFCLGRGSKLGRGASR